MMHNPYLPCLNAPIAFPLSITFSFHLKSTSALMFSLGLTQVTHMKPSLFSTITTHAGQLRAPALTAHLLSSSARSLSVTHFKPVIASLNTFWSNQLLVFCSTIAVSSYSNSYELVTVTAAVIC
ncbi:hypothetical protein ACTXT7_008748 [Hymenolepis weldensis]